MMITGVLIAESLRVGATLRATPLTVREIRRVAAPNPTADQPATWTLVHFDAGEADADALAKEFADSLDQPGWYVDFHSPGEIFVVFPGRGYRRGDTQRRAEAQAYGHTLNIPEQQLDWPL